MLDRQRLSKQLLSENLRKSGFSKLWLGETLSATGSQLSAVAIPFLLLSTLGASASEITLLSVVESLAVIITGLMVGTLADSRRRQTVLFRVNVIRGVLFLTIPAAILLGRASLEWVLLIAFLTAALGVVFDSLLSGFVRDLVPPSELVRANGYLQATQSVGEVGGPSLAGAIVSFVSIPVAITLDGISFLFSAVFLKTIDAPTIVANPSVGSSGTTAKGGTGFSLLWENRPLRATTQGAAHFNLFASLFFALYLFHLVSTLQLSPIILGVIFSAGGLGGILAGLRLTNITNRVPTGPLLAATLSIPGGCALLVAMTKGTSWVSIVALIVSAFVWSFCVVVNVAVCETIKQLTVPEGRVAQVTAAIRSISWGIELLGAGIAWIATSQFAVQPTTVMVWAACGLIFSSAWIVRSLNEIGGLSLRGPARIIGPEE